MKKIVSLILVIIIAFNCVGCNLLEPMTEEELA